MLSLVLLMPYSLLPCPVCYQLFIDMLLLVVMVTGYNRSESVRHVNYRWQCGKKIGQLFSVLIKVHSNSETLNNGHFGTS